MATSTYRSGSYGHWNHFSGGHLHWTNRFHFNQSKSNQHTEIPVSAQLVRRSCHTQSLAQTGTADRVRNPHVCAVLHSSTPQIVTPIVLGHYLRFNLGSNNTVNTSNTTCTNTMSTHIFSFTTRCRPTVRGKDFFTLKSPVT